MRQSWARVGILLCLVWVAAWIVVTRFAMLDDSLIHLRYAANFDQLHFVTYDKIHHTFGTSSPLYLFLLAAVYAVIPGVFVPKAVSVVIYVTLLFVTVWLILRSRNTDFSRGLAFLLLLAFISPMGVRWLADGMESGLVCLAALVLAEVSIRALDSQNITTALVLLALGLLITLLRIELLALCGICAVAILFGRLHRQPARPLRALLFAAPVVLGGIAAMLIVHLIFGNFLPDTALAKAYNKPSVMGAVVFVKLMAGSFALGVGTFLLWIVSAVVALRSNNPLGKLTLLAANSMFPILVLLACARGQAVQGVRYFIWAMLFSIAWNLYAIANATEAPRLPQPRLVLVAIAALIALLFVPDTYFGAHTMLGRSKTFQQMRGAGFDRLSGHLMLADDIGFIGYFTQSNICDLNGLVNGRSFAALTQPQRIRACVNQHPDALFLTTLRIGMMRSYIPNLDQEWIACKQINFPNVHSDDTHYLIVRASLADQLCPVIQTRQTIASILGPSHA